MDQAATVALLTSLSGAPPVETHISYVFLDADTVWKLKKSVRLPFLDFSEVEERHRFCARELELNAPHAPGLYRDIVPVTRNSDGSVKLGGTGEPIDWVLRMARVPPADFLDVMAAAQGLTPELLDRIADAVAAYHSALPPLTGVIPAMAAIAEGNVRSAHAARLPADGIAAWRSGMTGALAALAGWTEARAAGGFVRRCHGDLHLGNLCLWRGQPVPFDALEFDETLARIDVSYDLAFLLMDLEHRLDRASANRVLNRYVARTGDADLVRGLPAFQSMRAMVRAHVEARLARAEAAAGYLGAALAYLRPHRPVVVAIGGLPGTGKSTLARRLAPALGAAPGALVLRSDEIRKRQHNVAPERRLPTSAYTPEKSAAVLGELTTAAETAAAGGHAVIADATFMSPRHRAMIRDAAAKAGADFVGIWLHAPAEELERRVRARKNDASDATVAVLRATLKGDPGPGGWIAVDASDGNHAEGLARDVLKSHIVF